jgi:DNA repair exonuclease SbcCD ATPase subunit
MKILKLRVENILGIKEADISPRGESVTIGGANAQGKSSLINAIKMALGGKKFIPSRPVHEGEKMGTIAIDLGEVTVQLRVEQDRKTKIWLSDPDGNPYSRPQEFLNKVFEGTAFDPGAFKNSSAASQREQLLKVSGIQEEVLTKLDEQAAHFYDQRRDLSREVKRYEARLGGQVYHKEITEPVNTGEAVQDAECIQNKLSMYTHLAEQRKSAERSILEIDNEICELQDRIHDLSYRKEAYGRRIDEAHEKTKEIGESQDSLVERLAEVKARLSRSDEINAMWQDNQTYHKIDAELASFKEQWDEADKKLTAVKQQKEALLSNAKFPVKNLSVTDDGITLNGIPFDQLSESQQWEVCVSVGFELNQGSVLLLSQSGGLDSNSRERIRQRAIDLGVQLFMEVVDDQEDVEILMEGGEVAEVRLP